MLNVSESRSGELFYVAKVVIANGNVLLRPWVVQEFLDAGYEALSVGIKRSEEASVPR